MYLGPQVKEGFLQQTIKGVNHRKKGSTMLKLRNSSHQKVDLKIQKTNYKLKAYNCNMQTKDQYSEYIKNS